MRKFLTALTILLLSCTSLFAQFTKGKSSFGVATGINISTFREGVKYANYDPDTKIGFVLGAVVEIPVSKRFAVQPSFLYSQLGARAFDGINNLGDLKLRYNYFSVPIVVKYKLSRMFNAFAGIENDFMVRARSEDDLNHDADISNDVKDFDFAATAGFECWFNPNIVGSIRYIHGTQDVSYTNTNSSLYNQAIQVTIGYKFIKVIRAKKKK